MDRRKEGCNDQSSERPDRLRTDNGRYERWDRIEPPPYSRSIYRGVEGCARLCVTRSVVLSKILQPRKSATGDSARLPEA